MRQGQTGFGGQRGQLPYSLKLLAAWATSGTEASDAGRP